MKYRLTDESGKCNYETYNNKTNSMIQCECKSNILAGKKHICKDHLNFALQSDRKPEVFNFTGGEITIKMFKALVEDFKPVKKKEVVGKWI